MVRFDQCGVGVEPSTAVKMPGSEQNKVPSAVELLQRLIRFDTLNPPGDERECALWLKGLLDEHGVENRLLHPPGLPNRLNVVARVPGRGDAPPLLLQGHTDVVSVHGQRWSMDPFGGEIADGCVWGRGAVDMKGGLTMMLHTVLRAKYSENPPPGDIILAAVADEELGGRQGAAFLVHEHPELFAGVRHAFGELGGFTVHIRGHRFYPIMVAEKHICRIRVTFVGQGGHGSQIHKDTAMSRAARALRRMERRHPPFRLVEATRAMLEAMSEVLPRREAFALRRAMNPRSTGVALGFMGEKASKMLEPLCRDTISPTIIEGGVQENAVPSEVQILLDCRLLPGSTQSDIVRQVMSLVGENAEIKVERYEDGPPTVDMSLIPYLGGLLERADPGSKAIPYMVAGGTDAKWFHELGIDTYGFTPMRLPANMDFMGLFHGEDERIPVDALNFGTALMHKAVAGYRG